jgi:hypothetical protein
VVAWPLAAFVSSVGYVGAEATELALADLGQERHQDVEPRRRRHRTDRPGRAPELASSAYARRTRLVVLAALVAACSATALAIARVRRRPARGGGRGGGRGTRRGGARRAARAAMSVAGRSD